MDIKALRFSCGRLASLLATAVFLSACTSTPPTPEPEEPAAYEPPPPRDVEAVVETRPLVPAQNIQLADDYPRDYTVKKGDTLWDIASMYLRDPWYWPEIWQRNPQVKNPHLIYPGDILTLVYINGVPRVTVTRGEEEIISDSGQPLIRRTTVDRSGRKVVRLSPMIHRKELNEAIPSIPADAIRQFLTRPRVISAGEWYSAPYIVGGDDDHLVFGAHNKIYVRGELDKERIRYSVFREGNRLEDPETEKLLGYEIIYAGQARISQFGDPASGELTNSTREILVGDRLLPTDNSAIEQQYFPRVPEQQVDGQIISLFDAISSIAKYQIAVINRGSNQGLEVGHLLATHKYGGYARDRFLDRSSKRRGIDDELEVRLPDERSGIMMIFKVFDDVSYGLVLRSTRTISKFDRVSNPR